MIVLFFAIISSVIMRTSGQNCPSIYLRFSQDHSFCKPRNPSCPIFKAGLSDADRNLILDTHNRYRSRVATGNERLAGGMPQAADMMQMVWDKELAAVAQRRAEQCIYEHDCSNCRRVENFPVGQNIAYRELQCTGSARCPQNPVPDWTDVIKMFYDEVSIFNKRYVNSMVFVPGKKYGHFTQMVWASTWRIGCGFVAFQKGNGYRQLYVCNYGPSGNIIQQPMYKTGTPCSSCPSNSCCGRSCGRWDYDGLCRMNKNTEAPLYLPTSNFIFYCDFRSTAGDCSASTTGQNRWKYVKALGGSYAEIILNGGETSTLIFKNSIRPKQRFCLLTKYRSGPIVAGQKVSNTAVIAFKMGNSNPVTMNLPKAEDSQQFFTYSIDLGWSQETQVLFTILVPRGAPPQYFDIGLVTAKNGRC